jgi:hypothetical protein
MRRQPHNEAIRIVNNFHYAVWLAVGAIAVISAFSGMDATKNTREDNLIRSECRQWRDELIASGDIISTFDDFYDYIQRRSVNEMLPVYKCELMWGEPSEYGYIGYEPKFSDDGYLDGFRLIGYGHDGVVFDETFEH